MTEFHIVFHKDFIKRVDSTPAGNSETRITIPFNYLKEHSQYKFVTPNPAPVPAILRAHTQRHFDYITDLRLYEQARLAAGGAITSADLAYEQKPNFALIRPPGHHASRASSWGFCYFNNMAISLLHLKSQQKIKTAIVIDFDLHVGDGNIDILGEDEDIHILNPKDNTDTEFIQEIQDFLEERPEMDIICASAGFDQYERDWGGNISTQGYKKIGEVMKAYAQKHCQGRRYALFEGGYYEKDLGKNIFAFCEGFKD